MPKLAVKPLEDIAKKWVEVTPQRAPYYEAGVKAPLKDWATEAANAAPAYKSAVTQPNIDKLYAGGIKKVGTAKWQRKSIEVGVGRYGPGVTAALPDYRDGFAPYREELTKVEVPARGPRGADVNFEKVKAIGKALLAKRLALRAVS